MDGRRNDQVWDEAHDEDRCTYGRVSKDMKLPAWQAHDPAEARAPGRWTEPSWDEADAIRRQAMRQAGQQRMIARRNRRFA